MEHKRKISILGCGWLGLPLAKFFIQQGFHVKGSTTTDTKLSLLKENSIEPFLINLKDKPEGDLKGFLDGSEFLIINFPPKRLPNIIDIYPRQLGMIIDNLAADLKIIFVSSTSVYQNNNSYVREDMKLFPEKDSGRALVEAEKLLREKHAERSTILRFAGLVGDDRKPGRFLAGKREVGNGSAPVNLIHQVDCIGLIWRIIKLQKWGQIYNGCAELHPEREHFYSRAAEKIGLLPPTFLQNQEESFKIVDNQKSRTELQYEYQYPNPMEML